MKLATVELSVISDTAIVKNDFFGNNRIGDYYIGAVGSIITPPPMPPANFRVE